MKRMRLTRQIESFKNGSELRIGANFEIYDGRIEYSGVEVYYCVANHEGEMEIVLVDDKQIYDLYVMDNIDDLYDDYIEILQAERDEDELRRDYYRQSCGGLK